MTYFMQSGDSFIPTAGKDALLDTLPAGNYTVAESMTGLYFKRVESFPAPGKLYGDIAKYADRIVYTFLDRERATGALFAGEKGSGKTQLARLIAYKGYALGLPTILVNAPYAGDPFNNLLATIEQPAIVVFDEFEKVYDKERQEAVLTLLDGTMTTKKLFLLTVNDKYAVNSHMKNRPGRLFYSLQFDGLESSFVREYCEDNLHNQDHIDMMVKVSTLFTAFNFDMLKALVEEMNRYKEDPFEALKMLNAKPIDDRSSGTTYTARVWNLDDGREVTYGEDVYTELPMHNRHGAAHYRFLTHEEGEECDDVNVVRMDHLKRLDAEKGIFEFHTDQHKVIFTKQVKGAYDVRDMFLA